VLVAGIAVVYPTLFAAVGDVAHPAWRACSVGVYRLWRDGRLAVGAVLIAASGIVVAARMYETLPARNAAPRP
jgi:hypothetical protein